MTWLIEFTDDELTAIYDAIEQAPVQQPDAEALLQSVIHKITPVTVGNPTPSGAKRA